MRMKKSENSSFAILEKKRGHFDKFNPSQCIYSQLKTLLSILFHLLGFIDSETSLLRKWRRDISPALCSQPSSLSHRPSPTPAPPFSPIPLHFSSASALSSPPLPPPASAASFRRFPLGRSPLARQRPPWVTLTLTGRIAPLRRRFCWMVVISSTGLWWWRSQREIQLEMKLSTLILRRLLRLLGGLKFSGLFTIYFRKQ